MVGVKCFARCGTKDLLLAWGRSYSAAGFYGTGIIVMHWTRTRECGPQHGNTTPHHTTCYRPRDAGEREMLHGRGHGKLQVHEVILSESMQLSARLGLKRQHKFNQRELLLSYCTAAVLQAGTFCAALVSAGSYRIARASAPRSELP